MFFRWKTEQEKVNFYASLFSHDEMRLYQLLTRCRPPAERNIFPDDVLCVHQVALLYWEDRHDELISLVEVLDPDRFRSIRLPIVTGSFLEWDGIMMSYSIEIWKHLHEFLLEGQKSLQQKVKDGIKQIKKPC